MSGENKAQQVIVSTNTSSDYLIQPGQPQGPNYAQPPGSIYVPPPADHMGNVEAAVSGPVSDYSSSPLAVCLDGKGAVNFGVVFFY
jgi:hypothetical protein